LGKNYKTVRREIHTVCSDIIDAAFHGEGGEQLWVGILPGPIVRDLTLRLPRKEYPTGKMQIPSKWRTSILSLLQILARGTQLAWQAKEKARTERLHGLQTMSRPVEEQPGDGQETKIFELRTSYRRIAFQQAQQQAADSLRIDRESIRVTYYRLKFHPPQLTQIEGCVD